MRFHFLVGSILALSLSCGCEIKTDTLPPSEAPKDPSPVVPKIEAKPAEVGVGVQGQSLKNETGVGKIIAQPAVTLFQTKERVAFDILIPEALKLFKASEGRSPESHEEFMEKIIKFNQIKLPKLPAGQEYRFRPEEEKLWVEPIKAAVEEN